ncbi:MAG: hypothetical protein JJ895_06505 [Balneolaceae bacterium]|nr:hypothetical protein [Balneolaceae bacterium]
MEAKVFCISKQSLFYFTNSSMKKTKKVTTQKTNEVVKDELEEGEKTIDYLPLINLLLAVLIILTIIALIIYFVFDNWTDRGTFGDMFGAINTLFSGLAFAGVIYAIILQSRELELQRREMRASRSEYRFSNRLRKMEILNDFYNRYESEYYRKIRKESAELILAAKELPTDNSSHTKSIDDLLNFFQELGILLKHEILDVEFVANRFATESRAFYLLTHEYIIKVQDDEGPLVWESVCYLINKINEHLEDEITNDKALDFIKKESLLDPTENTYPSHIL